MQISNILSKLTESEKPQDVFLAIEISSEFVISALWTVLNGKTKLIKMGPAKEWEEEKELLLAVDASISSLLVDFPKKIKGVIFGLEEAWVKDSGVLEEKQLILKKICNKLELKPLGFVVVTEALIQYLKIKEGLPLSAILVKLEQTQATIALVKLGKIIRVELVGRSDDLSADLKEALVRFGDVDSFPSRILLFDGLTDFEEARQQIISYDWLKELPFLHIPRVDILENNIAIKAIAIAGGSEIAKSLGFDIKEEDVGDQKENQDRKEPILEKELEEKKEEENPNVLIAAAVSAINEKEEEKEEIETDKDLEEDLSLNKEVKKDSDDFNKEQEKQLKDLKQAGFLAEKDILEADNLTEVKEKIDLSLEKDFKVDGKKDKKKEGEKVKGKVKIESRKDSDLKTSKKLNPKKIITKLVGALLFFKKIPFKLAPKKSLIFIVLPLFFLFLFFILGFAAYWFLPKAEITLYFRPEEISKNLEILADKNISKVDLEKKLIPVEERNITIEGSKTINTSGKKLIGDKAKGKVIVYNKTSVSKSFSRETPFIASNGLKFYLDEDVEIASKSAEESVDGEKIVYGKKEAVLIAAKIGPEYNLKKDTEFSVDDFSKSSFSALNDEDFSGGTSREVASVSEDDQAGLLESLKAELNEEVKEKLSSESEGEQVLNDGKDLEIIKEEFDKEVGDDGDSLSLDLEVSFLNYVFSESDFNLILADNLLNLMPDNFTMESNEVEDLEVLDKTDDGQISLKIKLKAMLLPKIETEDLKQTIKGKYPRLAEEYFNTLPNFNRAEIKVYPKFFLSKLQTFPRKTDRITFNIKIEK